MTNLSKGLKECKRFHKLSNRKKRFFENSEDGGKEDGDEWSGGMADQQTGESVRFYKVKR